MFKVGISGDLLNNNIDFMNNIAIGRNALDGTGNAVAQVGTVAIGFNAGTAINHSDAQGSVFVGYEAGKTITQGQGNVAIGYEALSVEDDGDLNTAVGYQALQDQVGVSGTVANTAVGYYAGTNITTGIKNTMLGAYAGYTSLLVDNATCVGYNAGGSAAMTADADGTVAVGWSALANLTSGAILIFLTCTFKIFSLPIISGFETTTCLSNLPGLNNAGSKTSGLLVAAIIMTPSLVSKPSISTNN